MAKELDLRGAFRWGIEFDWAVDYLSSRRVDVRPLLSGQFPLQDAVAGVRSCRGQEPEHQGQVVAPRLHGIDDPRVNARSTEETSCVRFAKFVSSWQWPSRR